MILKLVGFEMSRYWSRPGSLSKSLMVSAALRILRDRNFEIKNITALALVIRRDMETYLRYLPLRKVYLENHRAQTDIPVQRLREIKAILEESEALVVGIWPLASPVCPFTAN